ncbi:MAG: DUF5056 domain-containing protein [Prevotella sp.]|nr:DUF5056 domain-containing protein [Prevotella sp.]
MKTDDELLEQFFSASKLDIEDNGFSDRVMRQIPQRAKCANKIWTTFCFAAVMALFLLFDGIKDLRMLASNFIGDTAGYLASIDLSRFSPTLLLASALILGTVGAYNVLSNQR